METWHILSIYLSIGLSLFIYDREGIKGAIKSFSDFLIFLILALLVWPAILIFFGLEEIYQKWYKK